MIPLGDGSYFLLGFHSGALEIIKVDLYFLFGVNFHVCMHA